MRSYRLGLTNGGSAIVSTVTGNITDIKREMGYKTWIKTDDKRHVRTSQVVSVKRIGS